MPELIAAHDAFMQEHRRCGELGGGVEGSGERSPQARVNQCLIWEGNMPLYMAQFAYTVDAWAAFTKNPENRTAALQNLAKKVGAKVEALYYSFVSLLPAGPPGAAG
jgi:hypothetical protein